MPTIIIHVSSQKFAHANMQQEEMDRNVQQWGYAKKTRKKRMEKRSGIPFKNKFQGA